MFRFSESSSGQFLKQIAFSKCAHYGIPYCLQVILGSHTDYRSFRNDL